MLRTSEAVDALSAALVEFHKKDVTVHKDSENPHYKSTFASLAANIAAADVTAAECGLFVVQLQDIIETDEGLFDALTTRIGHTSGQFMEATGRLHLPKQDPQGQGSAMTYGRRYNYQGAYGLVAEDDDGEQATKAAVREAVTPAQAKFRAMASPPEPGPDDPATQQQVNMIRRLTHAQGMAEDGTDVEEAVKENGDEWDGTLSGLTKAAASRLIDSLKE